MRVIGVWIGMMMVVVVMIGTMIMLVVIMRMLVQGRPRQAVLLAESLIPARGIAIAVARTVFKPTADTLDMMVVAFLRQSDFSFETENLIAIFAHLAIHQRLAHACFFNAILKRVQHKVMIIEVTGFDKIDLGMIGRHQIRVAVNTLYQHAGKQKIRKDDDAPVAELGGMP